MNTTHHNQHGIFIPGIHDSIEYFEALLKYNDAGPEPHVCKWFGCGRHLTADEMLYGNMCNDHSIPAPPRQKITRYIGY